MDYLAQFPSLTQLRAGIVQDPMLSVLVRVKNEKAAIGPFLASLHAQKNFPNVEVIFLDSGSTDGTLEEILTFPASVYTIIPTEFVFGRTCNLLCSLARAPFLSLMSGHIAFENKNLLSKALDCFPASDILMGAYARQVPNQALGASSYERAYLRRRFPSGDGPIAMKKGDHAFSNAASFFTAHAWRHLPFADIEASEDYVWADTLLQQGGNIQYLPELVVHHSHNETPAAVRKRVEINLSARSWKKRSAIRASKYFFGVFFACVMEGARPTEAMRYAMAHGMPYMRRITSK